MPAAAYITGTVACSLSASFSALSPARDDQVDDAVLRGQLAQLVAVAAGDDRDRALGHARAGGRLGGDLREHRVGVSRVDDPRSTIALPDLRQSAEQSTVTLGRAS